VMTTTKESAAARDERREYSLEYSTSTAMLARSSIMISPASPALRLEPLAAITIFLVPERALLIDCAAEGKTFLPSTLRRTVSRKA